VRWRAGRPSRPSAQEINKRTIRARSPSSSLMTAAKLLEVMSRNSQHLRIVCLSHPDVGCSWMAVRSRFASWKSLNWTRVRNSPGRVKSSLSRLSDELIFFHWKEEAEEVGSTSRTTSFRRRVHLDHMRRAPVKLLSREQDVGRPAQPTSPNPANCGEKDPSKVGPRSRFSVLGRLSGEARLGQDAGRQHDHRPASEARRRSGTGAGDEKSEIRHGKRS
jgi:hypothetical protein